MRRVCMCLRGHLAPWGAWRVAAFMLGHQSACLGRGGARDPCDRSAGIRLPLKSKSLLCQAGHGWLVRGLLGAGRALPTALSKVVVGAGGRNPWDQSAYESLRYRLFTDRLLSATSPPRNPSLPRSCSVIDARSPGTELFFVFCCGAPSCMSACASAWLSCRPDSLNRLACPSPPSLPDWPSPPSLPNWPIPPSLLAPRL